ncbi:hypothetical protein NDU88_001135 [Pleurodeles waltl]|uniref:Uncharacterized protein n=1 Tax=Pleurodeles waltl TaxID=8319 RepID=A0AAV7VAT4_PLEWA|nr:hypothetical protein NDU88_001135 [Pleurodeles waltl]
MRGGVSGRHDGCSLSVRLPSQSPRLWVSCTLIAQQIKQLEGGRCVEPCDHICSGPGPCGPHQKRRGRPAQIHRESQDGDRHLNHGAGARLTTSKDAPSTICRGECRRSRRTQGPAPWSCRRPRNSRNAGGDLAGSTAPC